MNLLLNMLIGMGAAAAMFWIKPRDSGWDNKMMLGYFLHCMFFIIAAYSSGYWKGSH